MTHLTQPTVALAETRLATPTRSITLPARWKDAVAVFSYAVATVVFFWRVAVLGLVPVGYDLLAYFFPYKALVADLVRQGEMPLWNPFIYMGVPLMANIQAAVLYPPNAIFLLLPTVDALRLSIVVHVLLTGITTYLFARASLRLSPLASWVGGAAFAFGGFVGARPGHLGILHSTAWLPLLLLCLEQAVTRRSLKPVAGGIVVYAAQILAGHTQMVYMSGLLLGIFALYMAAFGDLSGRARLWPIVAASFVAAGAGLLAGAQLVPALELAREGYRSGGIPISQATTYAVQPRQLLNSLLPLYWFAPYVETAGYAAAATLPLVPAAIARRGARPDQWFFLAALLVSLLLALGDPVPAYGWLYHTVPGFDLFRAPGRWLLFANLSLALLTAIGIQSLRTALDGEGLKLWMRTYGVALGVSTVVILALRLWLGTLDQHLEIADTQISLSWAVLVASALALVLVARSIPISSAPVLVLSGLILFELYLAREPMEYNTPVHPSLYTTPPRAVELISEDRNSRMLSLAHQEYKLPDASSLRTSLPGYVTRPEADKLLNYAILERVLLPNVSMQFGLRSIDGYDGGVLPTSRWAELKRSLLGPKGHAPELSIRQQALATPNSRALGLFGVKYVLVNEGAEVRDPGWQSLDDAGLRPLTLMRNRVALPRAYVVHAAQTFTSEKYVLQAIQDLDLGQMVALDEEVAFRSPATSSVGSARIVSDRANLVVVEAETEQPGILVLSDSYYPGWKAYIDGAEARILRANYAVRAVILDGGKHTVRFVYEPDSLRIGVALSLLGALLVGALLASRRFHR